MSFSCRLKARMEQSVDQGPPPPFAAARPAPYARRWALGLLAALLPGWALAAGTARTPERYPEREIKLLIPYAQGGDADGTARRLAPLAQKHLPGAQFLLENRVGNSGMTAAQELASSPKDGYTLMLGRVGNLVIAPALSAQGGYDWQAFSFLAVLEISPMVCAVGKNSKLSNPRELLNELRRSPGKLKYATAGAGSIQNMSVSYMLKLGGLKPTAASALHLSSSGEVLQALERGEVDFICSNASTVIPRVKEGRLNALFSTSSTRMSEFSQIPTASEVGLRDMVKLSGWSALVAPRGLPAAVLAQWQDALKRVARDPEWLSATPQFGSSGIQFDAKAAERFAREQASLFEELAVLSRMQGSAP
ncbi:hypothetical protein DBR47_03990 [Paucibacter sp. KBW04]|uniref:Bug family tripartite tricarboxylate transporter substrate binding protein n=1 Tax=Paucibacter sp. KBW04 TaxID=2153361 RepID=UPI000F586A62|nr:tripartite tricarboxylate transporter substrate binding protein [Paucibacter sp. KBW04]RQO62408.1 hypothetical protein DBR47_03990 [Paucibacter sp. KBW04]